MLEFWGGGGGCGSQRESDILGTYLECVYLEEPYQKSREVKSCHFVWISSRGGYQRESDMLMTYLEWFYLEEPYPKSREVKSYHLVWNVSRGGGFGSRKEGTSRWRGPSEWGD